MSLFMGRDSARPDMLAGLRDYQRAAVEASLACVGVRDRHPLISHPTGAGKSHVIAAICARLASEQEHVLVLAHRKELLEQNAAKLEPLLDVPVSVYSAGLDRRELAGPVVVAGIQSVYRRGSEIANRGKLAAVIIDEAHLVPPTGEGRYLTLLRDLEESQQRMPTVIGCTATPYRLQSGSLIGSDHLFTHIAHHVSAADLTPEYLCPVVAYASASAPDTSQLRQRAGEFVADDVQRLMSSDDVVESAVAHMLAATADRNSVLIFCTGLQHAAAVCAIMRRTGVDVGYIDGQTHASERAASIAAFRAGAMRYMVNIEVLTTGFDATNIDAIAMLRPTLSPGLLDQIIGRGRRKDPGKANCLFLDYAENIQRHGPPDAINPPADAKAELPPETYPRDKPRDFAPCDKCEAVVPKRLTVCPECGERPFAVKHNKRTVGTSAPGTFRVRVVDSWYTVHLRRGADPSTTPRTLRVQYEIEWIDEHPALPTVRQVSEFVCFEHTGYAFKRACDWWENHTGVRKPPRSSHTAALWLADNAHTRPCELLIRKEEGTPWWRVFRHVFKPTTDDEG